MHYVGSTTVDYVLPGLRDENDIDFGGIDPLISIWLGNQTRIAAHYDVPDNIACVAAGDGVSRCFHPINWRTCMSARWTSRLPVSRSAWSICSKPDFDRFPKFREALEHAQVAELEPGDAMFIPSMWWHHVEGLDSSTCSLTTGGAARRPISDAADVLNHAFLSIRDLPAAQRKAWHDIFDHYIFDPDDDVVAHIPEGKRGVLSPIR